MKRLGEPLVTVAYVRDDKGFAGDCVYAIQRHFVECLLTGREFESTGLDSLTNVRARTSNRAWEARPSASIVPKRSSRIAPLPCMNMQRRAHRHAVVVSAVPFGDAICR
jgi:hypothetical protein